MPPPNLAPNAFLPRGHLGDQERRDFIDKRDRLFQACSPAEQRCLAELGRIWASPLYLHWKRPARLSDSVLAEFRHRHMRPLYPRLELQTRALAKIAAGVGLIERWRDRRLQSSILSRLDTMAARGTDDVLLVVIHVLRALPLTLLTGQDQFKQRLSALMLACASQRRVPAAKRMAAVRHALLVTHEWRWGSASDSCAELRKLSWRLLLEFAGEDMAAALKVADEQYQRQQPPHLLSDLDLNGNSELGYRLAEKFKPHHPALACDLLGKSIFYAGWQLPKLAPPARAALEAVMDSSSRLLASWALEAGPLPLPARIRALSAALQYGNPRDTYWPALPAECLAAIRALPPADQDAQLHVLARAVFYAPPGSDVGTEAHTLFERLVQQRLNRPAQHSGLDEHAVRAVTDALSILEDKVLSQRNRRVPAQPEHALRQTVDRHLHAYRTRLMELEPERALSNFVSLALELSNEFLIRQHMAALRREFEPLARLNTEDAGKALRQLIRYCGFSQLDDQRYRKTLCRETFDALLPVLEAISPAAATLARSGIGWNPRQGPWERD